MKSLILVVLLFGWTLHPLSGQSQSSPPAFPLAGDWQGDVQIKGVVHHILLHLNTNAEGKMTALEDFPNENSYGWPAIGGSFDGTHLTLRFATWTLNSEGTAAYPSVYSYDATVRPEGVLAAQLQAPYMADKDAQAGAANSRRWRLGWLRGLGK